MSAPGGGGSARSRTSHLAPARAAELVVSDGGVAEVLARVLDHLTGACGACDRELAAYPPRAVAARAGGRLRETVEGAVARVETLLRERSEAPPRVAELREAPLARALGLLTTSPRFQTWGVAALLLDWATESLRRRQGEDAGHLTLLGALVTERLDPDRYGARLLEDTLAMAHTLMAEALILRRRPREARRELERAEEHWLRGTSPWYHGARLELAGCRLLRALGRPRTAARHASELAERAQEHAETDLLLDALALVVRATADAGDADGALRGLQILERAWSADDGSSVCERAALKLEVVRAHATAGLFLEGFRELSAVRAEIVALRDPILTGHANQQLGVLLHGLGRNAEAVRALRGAWRGLLEAGCALDAARAGLDLAAVHAAESHRGAFADVVEELSEALALETLPRAAAAAILRFQTFARGADPDPEVARLVRRQLDGPRTDAGTHTPPAGSGASSLH